MFESCQKVYARGVYSKYPQFGLTVDDSRNVENIVAVKVFN